VGSRQRNRAVAPSVLSVAPNAEAVTAGIEKARAMGRCAPHTAFGEPGAHRRIVELLEGEELWRPSLYKAFVDR
jgi:UDP-N-acetylglucosamine 2-epimerase (hydrolysing)